MNFYKGISFLLAVTLFIGCSTNSEETNRNYSENIDLIKGGKTRGGEVKFISSEDMNDLLPLSNYTKYSVQVTAQIFESLLKINPVTLNVEPAIASSYSVNDAGDVFTFTIREEVYFHKDDCFRKEQRIVTPEDVKKSLEFACSGLTYTKFGNTLVSLVKGAEEFHENTKEALKGGIEGIKVKENKVIIELTKPFVGFDKFIAQPSFIIIAPEAIKKYGEKLTEHPVGTGPFMLKKMNADGLELVRNNSYWKQDEFGNQLPYLEKIYVGSISSKKEEMLAFRNKEIDMVLEIPVDEIENILGKLENADKNVKHKIKSQASLTTQYISFNFNDSLFSNKALRRALHYGINTEEIIEEYLGGEGYQPTNGLVPIMEGENNSINAASVNIELAQELLSKAGFKDGKGFPKTTFYVSGKKGSLRYRIGEAVVDQLEKNLNINLSMQAVSMEERLNIIEKGDAQIWLSGWVADYPDPQSFMSVFYSKNKVDNSSGYNSETFDKNYEAALIEKNAEKRRKLLNKCAQQINDEAVVIPVHTNNMLLIINTRVKGLEASPIESLNFTEAFIKEPKKD